MMTSYRRIPTLAFVPTCLPACLPACLPRLARLARLPDCQTRVQRCCAFLGFMQLLLLRTWRIHTVRTDELHTSNNKQICVCLSVGVRIMCVCVVLTML